MTDKTISNQENKEEQLIKIGLDLGNKNLKICGKEEESHEISMHHRVVTQYDYEREAIGDAMFKVKYKDKMYFVGLNCSAGLPENKGAISVRTEANMFKLVGLALELKKRSLTEGKFHVVTGTPAADYESYKSGYVDLMVSKDGPEIVIVDNEEYTIEVVDAKVTKQAACVAPSIRGWKDIDFIIFDFGGGTLDGAYFAGGTKKGNYQTLQFSLNDIMADLGHYLRGINVGIERPDAYDSGFLKTMEDIVSTGKYKNRDSVVDENGKEISLRESIDKWLQDKVNTVLTEMKIKFRLSDDDTAYVKAFYMGGGAKALSEQLMGNSVFTNNEVLKNPHFINVETYYKMACILEW